MPPKPHTERHFRASDTVRDVVIGMADGLTVPFALAAGLSGAVSSTGLVVTAGLAEISAGAIAMGLGGYLAARTDAEHYDAEYRREARETVELPQEERREVAEIFRAHGLDGPALETVVNAVTRDRDRWVAFMMKYELGLEAPEPGRAPISAATIGASYIAGGLIPLVPYIVAGDLATGLAWSAAVTLAALFAFGAIKGRLTGVPWLKAGLQTLAVGGAAAAVAYAIARMVR